MFLFHVVIELILAKIAMPTVLAPRMAIDMFLEFFLVVKDLQFTRKKSIRLESGTFSRPMRSWVEEAT